MGSYSRAKILNTAVRLRARVALYSASPNCRFLRARLFPSPCSTNSKAFAREFSLSVMTIPNSRLYLAISFSYFFGGLHRTRCPFKFVMVSSIFFNDDHMNVCPHPPFLIHFRRSPCALSPHIITSQPAFFTMNMLQFGHFLPNFFISLRVAASVWVFDCFESGHLWRSKSFSLTS